MEEWWKFYGGLGFLGVFAETMEGRGINEPRCFNNDS